MKIGAFVVTSADMVNDYTELEEKFQKLKNAGFDNCQLNCWCADNYTEENANKISELTKKYNVEITAMWCGAALDNGPVVWNNFDGPATLGIVPVAYRAKRTENLIKGAKFAKMMGVKNVITHVGFIPVALGSTEFRDLMQHIKYIAREFKRLDQNFLFETGQETPYTLLHMIESIGMDNIGINLDPANLITYGMANPVDALFVFGKYVMGIHAKDGIYPTYNGEGGNEVPIGEGMVDFPRFIAKLKEVGYNGPLTIEREITGEQQMIDIIKGKEYLEKLI